MKSGIKFLTMLGVVVVAFSQNPAAHAQATGTWVSGVGDDANPCSRTAPCKTFAGAISKTAAGGEIRVLDPGGFGAVTITKAITLDGSGTLASILAAGSNAINVQAGVNDVVIIRNLRLNGLVGGTGATGIAGINYLSGAGLMVEDCAIYGFSQFGIKIAPSANTNRISVLRTTLTNNTQSGLQVAPTGGTSNVTVSDVHATRNGTGIFVAATGSGATSVEINSTVTSENLSSGISATGVPSIVQIAGSWITHNAIGVNISGAPVDSFGNNVIAQNATNVVGTLNPNILK
jgi:hypothetical protein